MAVRSSMTATKMQLAAALIGAMFLVVGIAGFIPGITTDYETMQFAGHHSEAMLLGVFQVSILHNIVHVIFGAAGFILARRWDSARAFLIGGGLIYAILWIYGMVVDKGHQANFVPLNSADDWLHFGLAVAMVGLGLLLSRERHFGSDAPA